MLRVSSFFIFYFLLLYAEAYAPSTVYFIHGKAQGTTFQITYYAKHELVSKNQIDSIFDEVDLSLSIYKPNTLINEFNQSVSGVEMDRHLKKVVLKSIEIFKKSDGVFDITIYPLVQLWGFGRERADSFPDSALITTAMTCVGTDKIKVEGNRLVKLKPCVKIDVNAIAPGYTADLLASFLEKKGVEAYVVEVGGEIRVKGKKPNGNYLSIGIEAPNQDSLADPIIRKVIQMKQGAITTSGNYRQYREKGGKKASHLLDARTGKTLDNNLISVTVIAKDAMTADGYDNVLMGLGLEEAFRFLKKQKNMEAYFIYHKANGAVADTATAGFYKLLK